VLKETRLLKEAVVIIIFDMPSSSTIKSELLAQNPKSIAQNQHTIINYHQDFVVSTHRNFFHGQTDGGLYF
jgi:hypothetical protein